MVEECGGAYKVSGELTGRQRERGPCGVSAVDSNGFSPWPMDSDCYS